MSWSGWTLLGGLEWLDFIRRELSPQKSEVEVWEGKGGQQGRARGEMMINT